LRFSFVNELLKKYSFSNKRTQELNQILEEHNQICKIVKKFNDFWCIPLIIDSILYTSMVLFIMYIAFFRGLDVELLMFFGSLTLTLLFFSSFILISTVSVSTKVLNLRKCHFVMKLKENLYKFQAHQSYSLLNTIAVSSKNYPLRTRIQLNQYIERLGGIKIGFYCWSITAITKTNLIKV